MIRKRHIFIIVNYTPKDAKRMRRIEHSDFTLNKKISQIEPKAFSLMANSWHVPERAKYILYCDPWI